MTSWCLTKIGWPVTLLVESYVQCILMPASILSHFWCKDSQYRGAKISQHSYDTLALQSRISGLATAEDDPDLFVCDWFAAFLLTRDQERLAIQINPDNQWAKTKKKQKPRTPWPFAKGKQLLPLWVQCPKEVHELRRSTLRPPAKAYSKCSMRTCRGA